MATISHSQPPAEEAASRRRADWEAIERDYRTGQFSDQELADKHGNVVTRQAISKRAKVKGWQKDLSAEVRRATKAKLIAEQVAQQVAGEVAERVAKSRDATSQSVLAAAETNKQVILRHRSEIAKLGALTASLVEKLEKEVGEKNEKKRLPLSDLVLAAQRASQTMVRLQNAERVAFGLDEGDDPGNEPGGASQLTDVQRASRLATLIEKARRNACDAD